MSHGGRRGRIEISILYGRKKFNCLYVCPRHRSRLEVAEVFGTVVQEGLVSRGGGMHVYGISRRDNASPFEGQCEVTFCGSVQAGRYVSFVGGACNRLRVSCDWRSRERRAKTEANQY